MTGRGQPEQILETEARSDDSRARCARWGILPTGYGRQWVRRQEASWEAEGQMPSQTPLTKAESGSAEACARKSRKICKCLTLIAIYKMVLLHFLQTRLCIYWCLEMKLISKSNQYILIGHASLTSPSDFILKVDSTNNPLCCFTSNFWPVRHRCHTKDEAWRCHYLSNGPKTGWGWKRRKRRKGSRGGRGEAAAS